ncbi:GTP-binding protein [Hydrogenophaga sp. 5NK40-0174]|uniref:GTP-binding protein n=1 Tax=Hydrogenophaga sp. 5NK40-0174 TaxID=3127649 RepID=UPI003105DD50
MEWGILFMGPVGAGKTQAVNTLSDIATADTEVAATDATAELKEFTTVSMDAGVLDLGSGDKVRLIGAPGQSRFDFMWDILLEQAKAVVILIDHSRESRYEDLSAYLDHVAQRSQGRKFPLAIGVTHADLIPDLSTSVYRDYLADRMPAFVRGVPPIFKVDARQADDMRALVIGVAAMLEMESRFAAKA